MMQAIREALAVVAGVTVWRNNVGAYGPTGAKIFYGLAPGSADLVGVCVVRVLYRNALPDHGGQYLEEDFWNVGRFFALEAKTPDGHTSPERAASQDRWGGVVRKHGGFYAKVTSVEEALAAVERCRNGHDS